MTSQSEGKACPLKSLQSVKPDVSRDDNGLQLSWGRGATGYMESYRVWSAGVAAQQGDRLPRMLASPGFSLQYHKERKQQILDFLSLKSFPPISLHY